MVATPLFYMQKVARVGPSKKCFVTVEYVVEVLEFARSASHPSNLLVALVFSANSLVDARRIDAAHAVLDDAISAAGDNAFLLRRVV